MELNFDDYINLQILLNLIKKSINVLEDIPTSSDEKKEKVLTKIYAHLDDSEYALRALLDELWDKL